VVCVVGGLKLGLVGGSRIGNQWTQTEVVAPAKERRFGGGWSWPGEPDGYKLLANFNGHTDF
jgi:hypothetical protein